MFVLQMRRYIERIESGNGLSGSHSLTSPSRHSQHKDRENGHKSSFNSLFEQGEIRHVLYASVVWLLHSVSFYFNSHFFNHHIHLLMLGSFANTITAWLVTVNKWW